MSICPNITSPEWETLETAVGKLESYRDWLETGGEIRTPEEVLTKLEQRKGYDFNTGGVLTEAVDAQRTPIETKIRSLDRINNFLENIQVPVELADFGSTPALAAANFEKGIIQITDKFADRAEAWNELPEEAAHFSNEKRVMGSCKKYTRIYRITRKLFKCL